MGLGCGGLEQKAGEQGAEAGAGALPPFACRCRSSPGGSRLRIHSQMSKASSGAAPKTGLRRCFLQQIILQGTWMPKARSNLAKAAQAAWALGMGWGSAVAWDGEQHIPAAVGWQKSCFSFIS